MCAYMCIYIVFWIFFFVVSNNIDFKISDHLGRNPEFWVAKMDEILKFGQMFFFFFSFLCLGLNLVPSLSVLVLFSFLLLE